MNIYGHILYITIYMFMYLDMLYVFRYIYMFLYKIFFTWIRKTYNIKHKNTFNSNN